VDRLITSITYGLYDWAAYYFTLFRNQNKAQELHGKLKGRELESNETENNKGTGIPYVAG
jgi:hypothetical protein